MIVFEKWTLTKNLTNPDADAGVTTVARLFFFEKSSYKGCTRLTAANDKIYQWLAHGRWFSQGTPASSTTKTGRHDIAEKLLKVALNTENK